MFRRQEIGDGEVKKKSKAVRKEENQASVTIVKNQV